MLNSASGTPIFFNEQSALDRVRGNKLLLVKLLNLYLETEEIDVLKTAVQQNDWETAKKAVHTIKGIAGNLSLDELFAASKTLEASLLDENLRHILIEEYYKTLEETHQIVYNYLSKTS